MTAAHWVYDDGGRAAAGFKGDAGHCVTRAIAIATGLPYREIYDTVNGYSQTERMAKRQRNRSAARTGVQKRTTRKILADLGWVWHPLTGIGTGCTVPRSTRQDRAINRGLRRRVSAPQPGSSATKRKPPVNFA